MSIKNLQDFATNQAQNRIHMEEQRNKVKALKDRGFDIDQIAWSLTISPQRVKFLLELEEKDNA